MERRNGIDPIDPNRSAPLAEEEALHLPTRFKDALEQVKMAEHGMRAMGGKFSFIEIRDGISDTVVIDEMVVQAMKGGLYSMYKDLRRTGLKLYADLARDASTGYGYLPFKKEK